MITQRRNIAVQHHHTEILDIAIHRIQQKYLLHQRRIVIHRIEDRRHIHQQHGENIIQVAGIPEEHEHRAQHETHANVEHHKTEDGIQQRQKMNAEAHAVDQRKRKEHAQR